MQKFVQLIHQAFAKIDAADPKMRQKVYESIWLIQEKSLINQNIDEAEKQEKRQYLTRLLRMVEMEYRQTPPAAEAAAEADSALAAARSAEHSPRAPHNPAAAPQQAAAPQNPRPEAAENDGAEREPSEERRGDFTAENADSARDFANELPFAAEPPPSAAFSDMPNPYAVRLRNPGRPMQTDRAADLRIEAESPSQPRPEPADVFPISEPRRAAPEAAERQAASPLQPHKIRGVPETAAVAKRNRDAKAADKNFSFRRRKKWSAYIIGILSVFIAIFVAWSFYNSFGPASGRKPAQALSTAPMQQNNYGKNGWTEIFSPANISDLTLKGAASANLHNDPDANFIRIATQNADDAAIIEIGLGAIMPLRGKTADFMLIARDASAGGEANNAGSAPTIKRLSMAVDFGEKLPTHYRFELSPTAKPILFRLVIPQNLKQSLKFSLSGDAAVKQSQVDIYALLARKADDNK